MMIDGENLDNDSFVVEITIIKLYKNIFFTVYHVEKTVFLSKLPKDEVYNRKFAYPKKSKE